jgi:hypothetical protein
MLKLLNQLVASPHRRTVNRTKKAVSDAAVGVAGGVIKTMNRPVQLNKHRASITSKRRIAKAPLKSTTKNERKMASLENAVAAAADAVVADATVILEIKTKAAITETANLRSKLKQLNKPAQTRHPKSPKTMRPLLLKLKRLKIGPKSSQNFGGHDVGAPQRRREKQR